MGPGKGAFLMAEDLALQEVLRGGAAVDGHKWALVSCAAPVDRPRHQLLARAAFPDDEDEEALRVLARPETNR